MKIEELLQKEKNKLIENKIEDANLISKILLEHVLKINRSKLILAQEKEIEEEKKKQYEREIEKIIEGTPMQYITNYQEFMKLPFYVDKNVLIPQPDTEILVEEVIKIAKEKNKKKILDICTGSGAIGIALAHNLSSSKITISDISKEALQVAKKNAKQNNVIEKIELIESNLLEKIKGKFDIIVSNPPYIETDIIKTLSKQVQKEPKIALDGGKDGLYFYKKLIKEAPKYLEKDGYLCIEIGYNQKEKVEKLFQETKSYTNITAKKDLEGNDRVIIVQLGTVPNCASLHKKGRGLK